MISDIRDLKNIILSRPQDIFITLADCVNVAEIFIDKHDLIDDDLIENFSIYSTSIIKDLINYSYYVGRKQTVNDIKICKYLLNDLAKQDIVSCFLANEDKFYNAGFNALIDLMVDLVPDTDSATAILLFRKYNGNVNANGCLNLLSKIPNGANNIEIAESIKKCKIHMVLKEKETMCSDNESKKRVIKLLHNMPSLMDKINFEMILSMEDLKIMPPVARFNFIQFYFRYKVPSIEYPTKFGTSDAKINYKPKLNIEYITIEQMRELLFPVLLKKNVQVSEWLKYYEICLKNSIGDI